MMFISPTVRRQTLCIELWRGRVFPLPGIPCVKIQPAVVSKVDDRRAAPVLLPSYDTALLA